MALRFWAISRPVEKVVDAVNEALTTSGVKTTNIQYFGVLQDPSGGSNYRVWCLFDDPNYVPATSDAELRLPDFLSDG